MGPKASFMLLTALALAALALAAGPSTPASRPASAAAPSWDSYRIIVTRNIFQRDRSSSSRRGGSTSRPAARDFEHSVVLTGVALQDAARVAFFEDVRTGETTLACVGQTLGAGTIASISLDSVEYQSGTSSRKIAIGENLAGAVATPSSSPAASQPASGPSTNAASKGGSEIEERMRQRRLQETQ